MFRSLDNPQRELFFSLLKLYVKFNYFIKCFGDAAAYRLYVCVCCICCSEGGRPTDLPATDTTYKHKHVKKNVDYYNITVHSLVCNKLRVYKVHGATMKIIRTIILT